MGYSIQVGAFTSVDNAVRLAESLEKQGMSAYYLVAHSAFIRTVYVARSGRVDAKLHAEPPATLQKGPRE